MISTRMKEEGRGFFIASNLRVWLSLRADPRKLKREIVQNPTSAKIATLENFPLYGMYLVARRWTDSIGLMSLRWSGIQI